MKRANFMEMIVEEFDGTLQLLNVLLIKCEKHFATWKNREIPFWYCTGAQHDPRQVDPRLLVAAAQHRQHLRS